MSLTIPKTAKLEEIEKAIEQDLPGKDLWGDIDLSEDEFLLIEAKLRALAEKQPQFIKAVLNTYPVTFTTYLVFLARYRYNNNFWGLLESNLGITLSQLQPKEIGDKVKFEFTLYGMDYASGMEDGGHANIGPIVYEAGLPPESCLNDLFYIMKYDSHAVFEPRLMIEDLIDMRSYAIRKPLMRFLKRFQDTRALDYILELRDAILTVDQAIPGDSRYSGLYREWKNTNNERKAFLFGKKKGDYLAKPYLMFESGRRGLCLVLPRTYLEKEWLDTVCWRVLCDDIELPLIEMNVIEDIDKRMVDTKTVSVRPAVKYQIQLLSVDAFEPEILYEWNDISGIEIDSFLYFNDAGRCVAHSKYLQYPSGVLLLSGKADIAAYDGIVRMPLHYPLLSEAYSAYSVLPQDNHAKLVVSTPNGEVCLAARPQITLGFDGPTLFGLSFTKGSRPIFTDLPTLLIDVDEGIELRGLEVRSGQKVIALEDRVEYGHAEVRLSRYRKNYFSKYGVYSLRIYQNGQYIKQAEFCYAPEITTDYRAELPWPTPQAYSKKTQLRFSKYPEWNMEFSNGTVSQDEDYYYVTCPAGTGVLHARLESMEDEGSISFEVDIPLLPFSMAILDANGEPVEQRENVNYRTSTKEMQDSDRWFSLECYGAYRSEAYTLQLRTVDGITQREHLPAMTGQGVNMNLNIFHDSILMSPLPACIELSRDGHGDSAFPVLTITDVLKLKKRPRHSVRGGNSVIWFPEDADPDRDLLLQSFCEKSSEIRLKHDTSYTKENKKGVLLRLFPCEGVLKPGLYAVRADEVSESVFDFEDALAVTISNGSDTLYIPTHNTETPTSFSEWLELLVSNVLQTGPTKPLDKQTLDLFWPDACRQPTTVLLEQDQINLVALAVFATDNCQRQKKEEIRAYMAQISAEILTSAMRTDLARTCLRLQCPAEVFDLCLTQYSLLLMDTACADARELAAQLEPYSQVLSLFLLMGNNAPFRETIRAEKYQRIIGKAALSAMIAVPGIEDRAETAAEQKRFLREWKDSKVEIQLPNDIVGAEAPLKEMIDYNAKMPKLMTDKKPDVGIPLDGIRYIDQYIQWYKRCHNADGQMDSIVENSMQRLTVDCGRALIDNFKRLERIPELESILRRYRKGIRDRYNGDPATTMSMVIPSRFFYLQAIAALLAVLSAYHPVDPTLTIPGVRFIIGSAQIAPGMVHRDLMMASTFLYLTRKEEQLLCQ